MTTEERNARIAELEANKGQAQELLNLQLDDYRDRKAEVLNKQAQASNLAGRVQKLSKGGQGTLKVTIEVKDDPDNPKAVEKYSFTLSPEKVSGNLANASQQAGFRLAELIVAEANQEVVKFNHDPENTMLQTELNARAAKAATAQPAQPA